MKYALIDDATLESAKRMEGIIPGNNTLEVAGDILALENLIQAILFCDEILYLDADYNKKSRKIKAFDALRRVNLSEDMSAGLLAMTNKMTDNYVPCIEGGSFTDPCFVSFFRDLDMQIRFVWEKKDNAFYLTPKIIRSENYTNGVLYRKLLGAILNELTDKSFLTHIDHRPPLLYDSEGQIINNCYQVKDQDGKSQPTRLSPQAEALFQAINFMAFRSNMHLIAARELGAELILSPLRNLFQWSCYHYFYLGNQGAIPPISGVISGSVHCPVVVMHGIPKYIFWITEHMNCEQGFIKAAYELREEKEFVALRRYLNDRSEKSEEQLARIHKKYRGVVKKGLTSAIMTRTPGMPEQSKISPLPNFPIRPDRDQTAGDAGSDKGQHFSITFRSIRDDMLRLDETPEYFDAVTSKIQYKPEAALQNIKVETNKAGDGFRPWEIPM